ncbi:MAG TPA: ABC transporter permease [Dehalococcoidia bacterium]|nr:ABC transporter permease [Dehalococcoidia bacterium]
MSGARLSAQACRALLLRDLRAVLRSRSQLYSSLLLPLMILAIVGTGVSEGLDPSLVRDGDYSSFLVPGVIVITLVFSSTFSSASYYHDRDWGVLRVMLSTPNPPWLIMLGKSLGGVMIGSLQAIIVLLIAAVIPALDLEWQYGIVPGVLLALLAVLLLAMLLNGTAQLLAARIQTMQGFHLVMNLVLFPLLFFSGAFFPLDDLPTWLKGLAILNPLSYPVDMLRIAIYAEDSGFFGILVDFLLLGALAPLLLWLGIRRAPIYNQGGPP